MRKKGKQFKRRLDPLSGMRAIGMLHGLDDSQLRDLSVAMRVNLEAIRTGSADESSFHTLAATTNVSMVFFERGLGDCIGEQIKAAQNGLMRLWARGKKTGRWVFDGEGLSAAELLADIFEGQLAVVTRAEALAAMKEVNRRITNGQVFKTETENE